MSPNAWLLVLLVNTYSILSRLWAWYRLRHINGPTLAGWSIFWLFKRTFQGTVYDELETVSQQYGQIARIAPNFVVCNDPGEVRRMWAVRSDFERAPWYKGFQLDPPHDCTLSMRDSKIHVLLRSKLGPGYSGKGIEGLPESIDNGVARFIRLIEDKYLSTSTEYRPVNLGRKIQYMTLDVISSIAFGQAFGFMDDDADKFEYIKTTEDALPMMQLFALMPWLIRLIQSPLGKVMLPSERDAVGLGRIIAFAKQIVGKRFGPKAVVRQDMLGSFVRHGLSQREAEAESLVQIIAGSDTTAAVLRTFMLQVVTNGMVLIKLRAEIDTAVEQGRVSSPIIDTESRSLPYLQACIKESLRIWPPITGLMPRVSEQDTIVCGVHIPAGTNVAWSAKAVLRNKAVFGDDSEIFSPERWLNDDPHRVKEMENTVDLCFGHGKWGCLGRPIAMMELNKMTVELIRRFDFSVVNTERPVNNTWHGVLLQSDLLMRVSRRSS